MSRILWRASARYLLHHPWQIGLSFLGIALGVAVVVAIDLANDSAERAFTLSTESIVGRATHQILGGPAGLPEEVYRRLRLELGIRSAAPVVEGDVAAPDYAGRTFHLLGIDPFADASFRPYLGGISTAAQNGVVPFLTQPATCLLSSETASALGLTVDDALLIRVGSVRHWVTIVGLLEPDDDLSKNALENLLVTDIATAQELLGMPGVLSRVDLIIPSEKDGQEQLADIQAVLPPGAEVLSARGRSATIAQMTRAFSLNLMALSLLALIVGMFLIYNTMTFSVVQRRPLIGMLRVLGVTQTEIFAVIVGEALFIGAVGTLAGVLLGMVLAQGLVVLVTQTITDLYFLVSVRELSITPLGLFKGVGLGLGATVVAALAPALEATRTPARTVLNRSSLEAQSRQALPWAAVVGVVLIVLGGSAFLLPTRNLVVSFGGLFAIFLGCVLLTPVATVVLVQTAQRLVGQWSGTLGRLCLRSVVASLSRTAIAIAALMVAVSVTVGVGTMVESFRRTVADWLETALHADIYVSAPSLVSRGGDTTLASEVVERLSTAPGVARANTYRRVLVESGTSRVQLVALRLDARSYPAFRFIAGEPEQIWPAFQQGQAVIISEPYAYHNDVQVASVIRLRTDRGERDFRVAGVFADYGSDQGVVMMSRQTYEAFWDDRAVTSLGIYANPERNIPGLITSLRQRVGAEHEVMIRSNQSLRKASLDIFDRTFTITSVLHLLTIAVAFVGVLSALMALQLERERELGVLRATGFTPRQIWGLMTAQTGIMGLIAGLLALPVGMMLASVLVFVINRRSFGWTLQLEILPSVLIQAVLLAIIAALLAGLYPAFRMSRTSPAAALREE